MKRVKKKEQKEKQKRRMNLPSLIFNIIETLLLVLIAYLLKIGVKNTLIVFLVFQISRATFKMPKHYKDWQKCLIWTLLIFTSLFIVSKVDLIIGVLVSVFTAYILSGRSDLRDMYMWNPEKNSKYQNLIDYIKFNGLDEKVIKTENNLRKLDSMMFLVYKRKFRENKTFREISDELDLDNPRIVEMLDKIYYYFIGSLGI